MGPSAAPKAEPINCSAAMADIRHSAAALANVPTQKADAASSIFYWSPRSQRARRLQQTWPQAVLQACCCQGCASSWRVSRAILEGYVASLAAVSAVVAELDWATLQARLLSPRCRRGWEGTAWCSGCWAEWETLQDSTTRCPASTGALAWAAHSLAPSATHAAGSRQKAST